MDVDGKHAENTAALSCQPCTDTEERVAAVKFCSVCKEWLCISSTKFHRRLKAAKAHALLY